MRRGGRGGGPAGGQPSLGCSMFVCVELCLVNSCRGINFKHLEFGEETAEMGPTCDHFELAFLDNLFSVI